MKIQLYSYIGRLNIAKIYFSLKTHRFDTNFYQYLPARYYVDIKVIPILFGKANKLKFLTFLKYMDKVK